MNSEWMKVMLEEIARKKSEATEAQAELERRALERGERETASSDPASDETIRGKTSGGRPPQ